MTNEQVSEAWARWEADGLLMHHETARRFIDDLDQGKYGTTPEDRASALAVLLRSSGTR